MGNMFLGVLFVFYTARVFGPMLRGEYAVITTLLIFSAVVSHLSLGSTASYELSKEKKSNVIKYVLGTLYFNLVVVLIITTIAITINSYFNIYHLDINKKAELILIIFIVPMMVFSQYSKDIFTIRSLSVRYEYYNLISKFLSLALLVTITLNKDVTLIKLILYNFSSFFILSFLYFLGIRKYVSKSFLISYKYIKNMIIKSIKIHFSALASLMICGIDILMLENYHGSLITGYYQLGFQLISYTAVIFAVLSSLMFENNGKLDQLLAWKKNQKLIYAGFISLIPITILLYLFADEVILLIGGKQFLPAVETFKYQIFLLFGIYSITIMSSQWIVSGLFIGVTLFTIFVGLINCLFNYLLIPEYKAIGAVYASLISYTLAFTINLSFFVFLKRKFSKLCSRYTL
jgi:O-antigen/teichoic acid export membrane protein